MGENWINGPTNKFVYNHQAFNMIDTTYKASAICNLSDLRSRAYVNPSIVKYATTYSKASCVAVPKRIHINPNFKGHRTFLTNDKSPESGSVHINPHFQPSKIVVSGNERVQNSSSYLNSNVKRLVNREKSKSNESKEKALKKEQSGGAINVNQDVCTSANNGDCTEPKNTLSNPLVTISKCPTVQMAASESKASVKKLNKNLEPFRKSFNIKTRHKIIHLDYLTSQTHAVSSSVNSKRKLLNRYKLVNVGKSEICNNQRSVGCMPGSTRISVFDLETNIFKKEKEPTTSENLKLLKLKHGLKRNSSVKRITNSIKTKYIYPNKILWHKRRQTSVPRNTSLKLDKRVLGFENIRNNPICGTYHSQKKLMSKTVPLNRVKTVPFQWKSPSSKYKSQNHFIWRKRDKKDNNLQGIKSGYPNRTVVKIGGIMYKSSSNKLTCARIKKREMQTANEGALMLSKIARHHIVFVRGEKFFLDSSGKTLIRQPKIDKTDSNKSVIRRIDLGGVTFIEKSNDVLIRTNTHQARQFVHSAKQRSIALLQHLRKRNNMPCMIYQRFGICRRFKKGICIYVHDPKNIDLCKKFLKGECRNSKCLLSHDAVEEKMATCHFFLKGKCNKESCPYLHVKVNKKAVICRDFLQGFCNLGQNCTKRHERQCPEFEEKGMCKRSVSCPYPHKTNAKRKAKISKGYKITNFESTKTISSGTGKGNRGNLPESNGSGIKNNINLKSKCGTTKKREMNMERRLEIPEAQETVNDCIEECIPKRVKLNDLPLFIPLQSE